MVCASGLLAAAGVSASAMPERESVQGRCGKDTWTTCKPGSAAIAPRLSASTPACPRTLFSSDPKARHFSYSALVSSSPVAGRSSPVSVSEP